MEQKLLSFNTDKSVSLVLGDTMEANQIRSTLIENTIPIGNNVTKTVEKYGYLGIVVSEGGAEASAFETLKKRSARVKQIIFEIRAILQDTRLNSVGGLLLGLELWKLVAVPYLYFSMECFLVLPQEAIKLLNDLHLLFYRCLLNCGRGTPIGAMFWFLDKTLPLNFITHKTLMLYFHI